MADLDELKAIVEQMTAAMSSHDVERFVALVHDEIIAFNPFSPFATVGKAAFRQAVQANVANSENITAAAINPQCQVIGTTGIVWSHLALARKPKDGPLATVFVRVLWTFVKAEGRWLLVGGHASRLPSGN